MDYLIVLRENEGNTFSIMGQALSANEHFLVGDHFSTRHGYQKAHFEINLIPEEMLLLHGQDYAGRDHVDLKAHSKRLRTPVALHPGAAVRVTELESSSAFYPSKTSPSKRDSRDRKVTIPLTQRLEPF